MSKENGIIDVFISYQSADLDFAKRLATSIEAHPTNGKKLKVFFDRWEIDPGTNIVEKINKALEKARFFLIVLSPEALEADWPTAERAAAICIDPSGHFGRVIPVLRRSCSIPPLLRFRNYADFRDESKYKTELTRILCALTGEPLPKEATPLALYRATLRKKAVKTKSPLVSLAESWKKDTVVEEIRCNLFLAESVPPKIWSAPYLLAVPPVTYFDPNTLVPPYITKEKRLFTFVDLCKENNVFRGVVEDFDVESTDTTEFFKDEVHSRWLVELLNWGIVNHCHKFGLRIYEVGRRSSRKKIYYYNKDVIMKRVKWPIANRRIPKDLLIEYKNLVAHRAVKMKFEIVSTLIFLKINIGWVFTSDGYRLIKGPQAGPLSTRFLSRQKNSQNFNEIRFWAWFLSEDGKKIRMDFGGPYVEVDSEPLPASLAGGIFGDYKRFSPITRGPPKIFEESASREEESSGPE